MYMEATGANQGDKTTLKSPYLYRKTKSQCLTFWYHMYGANIGTLNVRTTNFFFPQQVWSKSGNQGNLWRKAQVPLTLSFFRGVSVSFEGVRGSGYTGDIAVDDVSLEDGPCPRPGDCTFEKGRCTWLEEKGTDTFDWQLGSGATVSFSTGPSSDHTLGTDQGEFGRSFFSLCMRVDKREFA